MSVIELLLGLGLSVGLVSAFALGWGCCSLYTRLRKR